MTASARSFGGQKIGDSAFGPNVHTILTDATPETIEGPFKVVTTNNSISLYDADYNVIGQIPATIQKNVYEDSMSLASATDIVSLHGGSDTQWSAHGILLKPKSYIIPIINTSTFGVILKDPVPGKSFIIAAYQYSESGSYPLLFSTSVNSFSSAGEINPIITRKINDAIGGKPTYFVVFSNTDGITLLGKMAYQNLSLLPSPAFYTENLGILTAAPDTLSPGAEILSRLFVNITI